MNRQTFLKEVTKLSEKKYFEEKDFLSINKIIIFYKNNTEIMMTLSNAECREIINFLLKLNSNLFLGGGKMRNNLEIKMLPMLKENQKQEVDEKLRVFENYLKMIEEPDMYFLEKINELEKELEKDKLFLNAFLDMFEKYFNNYEEQFTLVLKHILKKSLALEIEGKLFQLVLNDNSFKQKYGNVSLEIVNDIIVDEDTISSFEAILSLKSH